MARYLAPVFIQNAISRGRSVEQFLGAFMDGEEPALRTVELRPAGDDVELWVHEVYDEGDEAFVDIGEFTPVDDDDDEPAARAGTLDEALAIAESRFGARPDRWVNEGMLGDEYLDHLRSR